MGKVLAVVWDPVNDCLSFPAAAIDDADVWTKRLLLHVLAYLYDPLGLVTPFALVGKILLQRAWKTGHYWDEPLPRPLQEEVARWWGESPRLKMLHFPRLLGLSRPVMVHLFSDESEAGYGCCIFFAEGDNSRLCQSQGCASEVSNAG